MSINTIKEDYLSYGMIRYFESDRCFNDKPLQNFNKGVIKADELVTFDCGLMEMKEIAKEEVEKAVQGHQILAIIIRPEIEPSYLIERDKRFEFCGYDLVESFSYISAITNCGVGFEKAIFYGNLNQFGLISTYREAVLTQINLNEEYPDESHANCELIEIWRYVIPQT